MKAGKMFVETDMNGTKYSLEIQCYHCNLRLAGTSPTDLEYLCRGAANHSRVAEGTRPSPEGVYSGVS